MALTVGNLFKESVKYNMKLLAGQAGLCRPVQWIHIIETNEGAQFLHGNEVVITECIAGNDEEKLQRFVGTIYRLHASALIINTGMFIKTVPDSVIAFCEEKQLPLFALPWEVPLVDVTREYCQMIIDNAAQEDTVATIMKDLIKAMDPKYIEVWGKFTPRGGISIDPYCNYGRPGTNWEKVAYDRLVHHDLYPEKVDNR